MKEFPDFTDLTIEVTPEVWLCTTPQRGDHIRVGRSFYYHHGIYIDDTEVIHFTGSEDDSIFDWDKCEVVATDLNTFLKSGVLEVKQYTAEELADLYPVEHIVHYARCCLGDKGYNLIFNNCEHFANVCTLGQFRSKQIENLNINRQQGGKKMGFLGWLGSLFGGSGSSSGSRSSYNTTYEPDKVKVAQIEADTKLRLANMETERIEIMKNARLEILEYETKGAMALEQARAQGFNNIAQTIVAMQDKLTELSQKRLLIIEKASLPIIKEIEMFYSDIGQKIDSENERYNTEKLPTLLDILSKYPENSAAHNLYSKRIEQDMQLQAKHYLNQINSILQRQEQVINGFLNSKEQIVAQTQQLTADLIGIVETQLQQLPPVGRTALPGASAKLNLPAEMAQLPDTTDRQD